jgi:hypothetical protein
MRCRRAVHVLSLLHGGHTALRFEIAVSLACVCHIFSIKQIASFFALEALIAMQLTFNQ